MKCKISIKRIIILLSLFFVTILVSALITILYLGREHAHEFDLRALKYTRIILGVSESTVIGTLGKPNRIFHKGSAPDFYYEDGYSYREREINNTVFIYIDFDVVAYYYFDDKNVLIDKFVGGS